jgi:competence protein ComEC
VETVNDSADLQMPMNGRVRLTVRWPEEDGSVSMAKAHLFPFGERLRAVARLLQPETYHDPGVWSREQFLVEQGITATASVSANRIERIAPSASASWACRLASWQHAASERLQALPRAMRALPALLRISPADAVMLAAMVTGDRTYLAHSLRVGFERTGSFHMLVVSGFHLANVTGCVFWVARLLHLPRVPATLITLAASFAYALFIGFATPVQRSLWMVTLYLFGRLLFRERSPLNTIGFAALCLLAIRPRSLFDAGLQMTLLAVVAIAGVAAPLLVGTIHPYLQATRHLRRIETDVHLPPKLAQFRVTLRIFVAAF